MNQKKIGFTLVEVIIIIAVVSIGIMTVIVALNNGNKYLQKSREKIIAINLAREGVEQMMNIRDSNRKKNAGNKESTRLKINPMDNSNNTRFDSGLYIILTTTGVQQYFYGSGISMDFNTNSGTNNNNLQFALCQSTGGRQPCPGILQNNPEGLFFRKIRGLGLFQKAFDENGGHYISCGTTPQSNTCTDSSTKEYRFCVDVNYFGQTTNSVELCSVLTNFKK